jgi:hypothetical protein
MGWPALIFRSIGRFFIRGANLDDAAYSPKLEMPAPPPFHALQLVQLNVHTGDKDMTVLTRLKDLEDVVARLLKEGEPVIALADPGLISRVEALESLVHKVADEVGVVTEPEPTVDGDPAMPAEQGDANVQGNEPGGDPPHLAIPS